MLWLRYTLFLMVVFLWACVTSVVSACVSVHPEDQTLPEWDGRVCARQLRLHSGCYPRREQHRSNQRCRPVSGAKGAGSFLHRSCDHGNPVTGRRAESGRGGPVWVNHRESVGAKAPCASWGQAERPGPALDPPLPVPESWLCRQVPAGIHL